jgi:hypothetical protein
MATARNTAVGSLFETVGAAAAIGAKKEKVQERTAINARIEAFCSKSERHAYHYQRVFEKYTSILKIEAPKLE